ncbi:hypothetical protein O3G_MSEX002209 [Manduca sexta]|uniref:STAS domain-containing protein n=1 Tax=Manduca sexta TaxID=7130 RepID=A0A921YMP0_MANSE|nr:hypothetical protein O3G_MSEX002209 [Manduca sexta]
MTVLNVDPSPCRKRVKKYVKNACSVKTVKKRLPIIEWLPKYKSEYIIQDIIAGITVGLTAIPQGIAYALIAGLPPEHGLYASLTSGVVYVFFGSCYNVTVGPTAILAAMTARYVSNYSIDFAILAAFLSGVMILVMGVLHLGFLVEFISMPVISGFTTAAALQIAASQLKSLFGTSGSSGNYFSESVYNFAINIKTVKLWEPVLGFSTVGMLLLLRKMGQGCNRTDGIIKQTRWFMSLSRNAIVVIIGMIITYILKVTWDTEPLAIIGDIGSGLPEFTWPPFSTTVRNETLSFTDMLSVLGPGSIALPLVAILESVAIAKAFAEGGRIDATQEMIALGLCNIIGSFGQSMPITGSFTRTALNHVSGVVTPAGGVTKVLLIIVALTYLTSTFYYIPKASLAGLIITAMFSMIDYKILGRLWRNSKRELVVLSITMIVCLFSGLEYGMIAGIIIEAVVLLYNVSRPTVTPNVIKTEKGDIMIVPLTESVSYCAAEHVRKAVLKAASFISDTVIIIDGTNLNNMDFTVASNLMLVVKDLEKKSKLILLLNFNLYLKNLCVDIDPSSHNKFVYAENVLDLPEAFPKSV